MKTNKKNMLTVLIATFFLLVLSANVMASFDPSQDYLVDGVPLIETDKDN